MTHSAGAPAPPPAAPRRRRVPAWARSALIVAVGMVILSITATLTGQLQLTSRGTTQAAVLLLLPILLAGLGGLWSERAGVINIGLEGMMILGTWGAAWAGYQWGPWAAVLGGIVFGALGGLLHAVATVTFDVNHIVSGVAINLLGLGVTKYLSTLLFQPVSQNPRQSPRVEAFDTYSRAAVRRLAGRAGGPAAGAALRRGRHPRRPAQRAHPARHHRLRARADQLPACCGAPGSGCGCAPAGRTRWPPSRSG